MSFTATSYRLAQPHSSGPDVPHRLEKGALDSLPIKFRAQLIHLLNALLDIDGRDNFYLQELWFFGSCARCDAHPSSDIDLLAVIADGCTDVNPQLLAGWEIAKSAACIHRSLDTGTGQYLHLFSRHKKRKGIDLCQEIVRKPTDWFKKAREQMRFEQAYWTPS